MSIRLCGYAVLSSLDPQALGLLQCQQHQHLNTLSRVDVFDDTFFFHTAWLLIASYGVQFRKQQLVSTSWATEGILQGDFDYLQLSLID